MARRLKTALGASAGAVNGAAAPVGETEKVGRGHPPLAHRFHAGNPGRPKGLRNKLGEHFIAALSADFEVHGDDVIRRVRDEDPAVYLRVIAQIVPQTVLLHEARLDDLSDDELAAYLLAVREALGVREGAFGRADAPDEREQAEPVPALPEAEGVS
jgi:hypothetical protein